jgi:hypothetical protein
MHIPEFVKVGNVLNLLENKKVQTDKRRKEERMMEVKCAPPSQ